MRIPWRAFFSLCGIALLALVYFIVSSNLRSGRFMNAVQANDAGEVARLLAKDPALVNEPVMPQGSRSTTGKTRWRGRTALHQLVSLGGGGESVAVADAFRAAGADFGLRLDGDTLLHLAAADGDLAMMTWLLDHGADVNARNGCEHPAEALCASGEFADWQPFDRGRTAGGDVCKGCDGAGRTPLHAAQGSLHTFEATRLLLARGADIKAVDAAGRTALHAAASAAQMSEDSRALCAYGADPSLHDAQGKLALDLAREKAVANGVDPLSPGFGVLGGWLAPGGGCAQLAARARPGSPVPIAEADAAWRDYVCKGDPQACSRPQ